MKLLLDTHALMWFLNGEEKLPEHLVRVIANTKNDCFVSIASLREIAIKKSLGKLDLAGDLLLVAGFLAENHIQILPISLEHIIFLQDLQFHHSDPFDRLIISQAAVEKLTVVT